MPLYKAIVTIPLDTGLPADSAQLTPWFNDHGLTTDPANLAGQICDVFMKPSTGWISAAGEITTALYQHVPGNPIMGPPKAVVTHNKGLVKTSAGPREIALTLSFYAGQNVPRRRGRLYLPITCRTPASDWQSLRPSSTVMASALQLATALSAVGGVDVDWVVHSHADDASYTVTNAWVDDEWDTQRRRGMRPTTRTLATVSG